VSRRPVIAILGGRGGNASSPALRLAEAIGAELGRRGYGIITGGDDGIAAAANRGCRSTGGDTFALLKWNRLEDAGADVDWSIPTSMDLARSNILNWTGDGLIAFEGRYGTLGEICLGLDTGRPMLVLGRQPFLHPSALALPTCRWVEEPDTADTPALVDLLESLIGAQTPPPVRPDAGLFPAPVSDAAGVSLRRASGGDAVLLQHASADGTGESGAPPRFAPERHLVILEQDRPRGLLEYAVDREPAAGGIRVDIVAATAALRHPTASVQALRLFARAAFAAGYRRVFMYPVGDDVAAIRIGEEVGFQPVGIMRRCRPAQGGWRDALLMDLLESDLCDPDPSAKTTPGQGGTQS
jgi:uncharacterized protein (TIGR00725 family)